MLQEYVPPPLAVSVAEVPAQMVVLAVLMFAFGDAFTVTAMLVVSAQLPAETITEYVVLAVGEIFIEDVVAPVVHE